MSNFNRVILMGYLSKDPELRYTTSGSAICSFGLAVNRVNRKYTTNDGEKKEEVDFFDVEAWGKTAENCSEYLSKGSPVLIEGRLKQERWEDQNGNKRARIKVIAQNVQFLGSKGKQEHSAQSNSYDKGTPPF